MGFDKSKLIWLDGKLVKWADATVHVSAHALHYGSGVFEGIRCYMTDWGPAVFRLDEHLERLYASASVYGIEIPFSKEQLKEATRETIRVNGFDSCYIRPICYYGSEILGLHPRNCPVHVSIIAWPWDAYLGAEGLETGARITISPWVRFHSKMMPTTAKATGTYLNSILAVRDAVARGYDEAILLDADGFISEGSGENLFIVKDGQVLTNDQESSILMGITRDSVCRLATDLGFQLEVRRLHPTDLFAADESFFTGTATEVAPVREVDGKVIGNGKRGPVTKKLQDAFYAAISGNQPEYRSWLDFVKPAGAQ